MSQQFDSSLIASDAEYDRHHGDVMVACDQCGDLFRQDGDEETCPACQEELDEEKMRQDLAKLNECFDIVRAYADHFAEKYDDAMKPFSIIGALTAFLAIWANRIPEIREELEKSLPK